MTIIRNAKFRILPPQACSRSPRAESNAAASVRRTRTNGPIPLRPLALLPPRSGSSIHPKKAVRGSTELGYRAWIYLNRTGRAPSPRSLTSRGPPTPEVAGILMVIFADIDQVRCHLDCLCRIHSAYFWNLHDRKVPEPPPRRFTHLRNITDGRKRVLANVRLLTNSYRLCKISAEYVRSIQGEHLGQFHLDALRS